MESIFFLFNREAANTRQTIESVLKGGGIDRVVVFQPAGSDGESAEDAPLPPMAGGRVEVEKVEDSCFTARIISRINSRGAQYNFLYTKGEPLLAGYRMAERMKAAALERGAASVLVYADHLEIKDGRTLPHPLTPWQRGSVRNDFDFGSLLLFVGKIKESHYTYAALYHAWLYAEKKVHIPEPLYTEQESDNRLSGAKQFDYVNPAHAAVQKEMEQAFTAWLGGIDLRITPDMLRCANVEMEWANGVEASVIIPVRNRERTIGDAIRSALSQEADFPFNVIVIDNHSTDRTPAVIQALAAQDKRVIHLQPRRNDLGIGGCWDLAIRDARCGKFAVQLDSDDLYSSPHTLSKIVEKFHQTRAAMVIGSYQLVDFRLNPLPPGLIDHKEWTDLNGPNNALRINGLGAPRAFFTPVVRAVGFPNVSYGEDYAVGLSLSAQYRIGRIYESLYLCRRWEGNSDAALSIEKVNRNNAYKDWLRTQEMLRRAALIGARLDSGILEQAYNRQLDVWPEVKARFGELDSKVERKPLGGAHAPALTAQYNPARVRSTAAKVDRHSIEQRPCFLCLHLQPPKQLHVNFHNRYQLCINPYPILHEHFTLPSIAHAPQLMEGRYNDFEELVESLKGYVVFYNGAQCGASAPDHFHFQIGRRGEIPLIAYLNKYKEACLTPKISLITDYACPVFKCADISAVQQVIRALPIIDGEEEPRFNLLGWQQTGQNGESRNIYLIIPRSHHRPDCYYLHGEEQFLISPGAVDMAGLLITVRKEDYDRLTADKAVEILSEVGLTPDGLKPVVEKLKKDRP